MVGLPGFEPGSFPHVADANTLREPKSPSLDQASRQPRVMMSAALFRVLEGEFKRFSFTRNMPIF